MKNTIVLLSILCACSAGLAKTPQEMTDIYSRCADQGFAERNRIIAEYVNATNSENAKSEDSEKLDKIVRNYNLANANNFFMTENYQSCVIKEQSK